MKLKLNLNNLHNLADHATKNVYSVNMCTSTLRWMWKWPCPISNGCSKICLEGLKKTTKTSGSTANF